MYRFAIPEVRISFHLLHRKKRTKLFFSPKFAYWAWNIIHFLIYTFILDNYIEYTNYAAQQDPIRVWNFTYVTSDAIQWVGRREIWTLNPVCRHTRQQHTGAIGNNRQQQLSEQRRKCPAFRYRSGLVVSRSPPHHVVHSRQEKEI